MSDVLKKIEAIESLSLLKEKGHITDEEFQAQKKKLLNAVGRKDPVLGIPEPAVDYGLFLLAIPVLSTVLIWLWIAQMNLLQSPGSTLLLVEVLTVVGTALLAAMEISAIRRQYKAANIEKQVPGAVGWFFFITLIWILGYPMYLYKRRNYGLANRVIIGTLVMILFFGSASMVRFAFNEQKNKVMHSLEDLSH